MLDSHSWRGSAGNTTCESELSLLLDALKMCLAVFSPMQAPDKYLADFPCNAC